jgi:amino acid transporter
MYHIKPTTHAEIQSMSNTNTRSALYVFFKIFLKSKIIPLEEVDIKSEFDLIQKEKAAGQYLTGDQLDWPWWRRLLHWI